mmetsp:Transcript_25301/g.31676  ORF Transcript_25301/g.31676 Transcript_25301/m.31676 type:complete len:86 (+) Transcript_25301:417-674(+)|eukprot:CAMPEP_0170469882 /NCGR_PEP_ID=MMETSP0123-20130129/12554_1 /TAXON_ID=182087 /ORGANISM="Favella ehrenbergii, Strain Fehren 1" /LENGTH=85 /DNA_ID=CAMNT_0010736879 /DNA_START=447 /DNA_END=704 /DNA_ORIENTATION=-
MVVVGNKVDLCDGEDRNERVVDGTEARDFARSKGNMGYFETSAKDDIGVRPMMEYIMEQTYQAWLVRKRQEEEEEALEEAQRTRE